MYEYYEAENEHGRYCVPKSSVHRPAAKKVLSNEVHEPETIAFMSAHCGSGDIIHAGAYFGDFLPALSKACAPGTRIWAFEPNSENHFCACKTLEINSISNVFLTHAALGSVNGRLPLKTTDNNGLALGGLSQITHGQKIKESQYEIVPVLTVDECIGEDRIISIIQLDVEGYEKEALAGAMNSIRRCLPIIIIEVWQDSKLLESEWFTINILHLGYCKTQQLHGNIVYVHEAAKPALTTPR